MFLNHQYGCMHRPDGKNMDFFAGKLRTALVFFFFNDTATPEFSPLPHPAPFPFSRREAGLSVSPLPLSNWLTAEAMRVSSHVAGMEMLATGTTCSLNHSVTTTTPDLVAASIEP